MTQLGAVGHLGEGPASDHCVQRLLTHVLADSTIGPLWLSSEI